MSQLLSPAELEARLREVGAARYHNRHPFHGLLHGGKLQRPQVQAWALNRFYYQSRIPMKDAALLARTEDPELRRVWRQRIIDHDGNGPKEGGIERWLALTDALGLDRDYVASCQGFPRHPLRRGCLCPLRAGARCWKPWRRPSPRCSPRRSSATGSRHAGQL
jgi:coenzyme PQQ biosynthesis protein C